MMRMAQTLGRGLLAVTLAVGLTVSAKAATSAEFQLGGIRLGDPANKVIELYGAPDAIVGPRGRLFDIPAGAGQRSLDVMEGLYFAGRGNDAMPLWATLVQLEVYRPDEREWIYRLPGGRAILAVAVRGGSLLETSVSQLIFSASDPKHPRSTGLDSTSAGVRLGSTYAEVLLQHGFPLHTSPFAMTLVMTPAMWKNPDGSETPVGTEEKPAQRAASTAMAGGAGGPPKPTGALAGAGGQGGSAAGGGPGLQSGGPGSKPAGEARPEPTVHLIIGEPITFSKALLLRYDNMEVALVDLKVSRLHIW